MLHVLGELIAMRHVLAARGAEHEKWVELDADQLQSVLPFWAPIDIRRIQSNLRELGLLKVSEGASHLAQRFEIDDGVMATQNPRQQPAAVPVAGQAFGGDNDAASTEIAAPRQGLPVYGSSANTHAASAQQRQTNGAVTLIPANWQPAAFNQAISFDLIDSSLS